MPVHAVLKTICNLCLLAALAACGGGGSDVNVQVPNDPAAPTPSPTPGAQSYRYVRLEATSEINARPWASMAEFNVVDAAGAAYPRTGWSITADSEENNAAVLGGGYRPAEHALDGNAQTMWHTSFSLGSPPMPHWVVVDMKAARAVRGFVYMPRSDGATNGTIAGFNFSGSNDGSNWTLLISGNFNNYATVGNQKTVTLP